jgi:two-component system cell cycle response regulator DivK
MPDALVLIVDDNERNLRLARDVLRAGGFRTAEAATGLEGVARALELHPDVVLMDVRLPDVDGVEAARLLKTDPRTDAIPVVALTSLAMKGDRERLIAAGFDGYLEKPISVRDLPGQVRAFCERRADGDL